MRRHSKNICKVSIFIMYPLCILCIMQCELKFVNSYCRKYGMADNWRIARGGGAGGEGAGRQEG